MGPVKALANSNWQQEVGIVVVGRNESDRLNASLESICCYDSIKVYVDSGSVDNSVELAKGYGVHIIELDESSPFTAARARNSGYRFLVSHQPDLKYVQFLDGDSALERGWLKRAYDVLSSSAEVGAVAGVRRERFVKRSVHQLLLDIEWLLLSEQTEYFGGDVMIRRATLDETRGYTDGLIAGEDPELSYRIRRDGWSIRKLLTPMSIHDSGSPGLKSWFIRMTRTGHSYMEVHSLTRESPKPCWRREVSSNFFWGTLFPCSVLAAVPTLPGLVLLLGMLYPVLCLRIYFRFKHRLGKQSARTYAVYCVLGKFPQAFGQLLYLFKKLTSRRSVLIEYK
jgi:glycosyltransferase involved in cell wall biosynthesis